jgi:hypothetical protein
MDESFLVLFFKKEQLARGGGGAAARKRKKALLFEKRSKNFCSRGVHTDCPVTPSKAP